MRSILVFGLSLVACGAPAAGDWVAIEVRAGDQSSVATGVLEIDVDGETLLDINVAGDGPNGTLEADGTSTFNGSNAGLSLIGTWTDAEGSGQVTVQGNCTRDGDRLACALQGGAADTWELDMRREGVLE